MGDVLGAVLDVKNESCLLESSNLKLRFRIFDAGDPRIPKPHPRYAEVAAACRASGMDIADDDYELTDNMSEDRPDDEPGFVAFLPPNVAN